MLATFGSLAMVLGRLREDQSTRSRLLAMVVQPSQISKGEEEDTVDSV
jgi:hypothetical protein